SRGGGGERPGGGGGRRRGARGGGGGPPGHAVLGDRRGGDDVGARTGPARVPGRPEWAAARRRGDDLPGEPPRSAAPPRTTVAPGGGDVRERRVRDRGRPRRRPARPRAGPAARGQRSIRSAPSVRSDGGPAAGPVPPRRRVRLRVPHGRRRHP